MFCLQADAATSFHRGKVHLIRVRSVWVVFGVVPYSEFIVSQWPRRAPVAVGDWGRVFRRVLCRVVRLGVLCFPR